MTEAVKHTPRLPWTTETALPFGEQPRIHDADGRLVAVVGNAETERQDEWEANAEFIVRAANAFATMRSALEMIAGKRQCLDNLMSNADIAISALANTGRALAQEQRLKEAHAMSEAEKIKPCPFCGGDDIRFDKHPCAGHGPLHHGETVYSRC